MTFQPGNNFGGSVSAPTRRWATKTLISELQLLVPDKDNPKKTIKKIQRVVRALVHNAMDGDNVAIKEIFDRIEGRVPHEMEFSEVPTDGSVRINPAEATDEEMAILMSIMRRRKAPQLEAQAERDTIETEAHILDSEAQA